MYDLSQVPVAHQRPQLAESPAVARVRSVMIVIMILLMIMMMMIIIIFSNYNPPERS